MAFPTVAEIENVFIATPGYGRLVIIRAAELRLLLIQYKAAIGIGLDPELAFQVAPGTGIVTLIDDAWLRKVLVSFQPSIYVFMQDVENCFMATLGGVNSQGDLVDTIPHRLREMLLRTQFLPGQGSESLGLPLNGSLIPAFGTGLPTFTRATTAYVQDHEGILRQALSGEARFQGFRRVRNEILGSSENPSGWNGFFNVTVTLGVTDPRGGNSAATITATANNGQDAQNGVTPYATSDSVVSSLWIRRRTGTGTIRTYNGNGANTIDITSLVNSSWQRFSPGVTLGSGADGYVGVILGTSGDAVDIAFAQIERVNGQSNQAPADYVSVGVLSAPFHGANVDGVRYFPTTNGNTVSGNVVTSGVGATISPLIALGYLSEGERTNLAFQSQTIDNAAWTKTSTTVVADNIVAPDATLTAEAVKEVAASSAHSVSRASVLTAAAYTFSVYLKSLGRQWVQLRLDTGAPAIYTYFDIQNGVVGTVGAGTTAAIVALPNGWFRCSVTITATAVSWSTIISSVLADNSAAPFTGDVTKGVYVWGAQLELGTFASSYIPTVAASVTRSGDVLTYPSAGNVAVLQPYSLYCESKLNGAGNPGDWTVPISSDRLFAPYLRTGTGANTNVNFFSDTGIGDANLPLSDAVKFTVVKYAASKAASRVQVAANGVLGTPNVPGTQTTEATLIYISTNATYGTIRNVKIYPTALTDALLGVITTPSLDVAFNLPLQTSLVPSFSLGSPTPTFTRATTAYVRDHEGILRQAAIGESRFQGARRVRNYVLENFAGAGWSLTTITLGTGVSDPLGGTSAFTATATAPAATVYNTPVLNASHLMRSSVWIRRRAGTGGVYLYSDDEFYTEITAELTSSWQRLASVADGVGASFFGIYMDDAGDAVDIWHPQYEDVVGQSNQAPSEYVSVGVLPAPYHGAGIDGVKYFSTTNGNWIDSNGAVQSAPGSPISPASMLGYLAEGARTNLCLQSQTITVAPWGDAVSPCAVANAGVAPDGTNTATSIEITTVQNGRYQTPLLAAATVYTFSAYFKAVSGSNGVQFGAGSNPSNGFINFNCLTGAVTFTGAGASNVAVTAVGNGWFRAQVTFTAPAAAATAIVCYTPDISACKFLVWGAQLEPAPFASSYIPTVAAAVTRNGDVLTYPSAGNVSTVTGSFYYESTSNSWANASSKWVLNYATSGSPVVLLPASGGLQMYDGVNPANGPLSVSPSGTMKHAGSYSVAGGQMPAASGVLGAGAAFDGNMDVTTIAIGCLTPSSNQADGTIRNVRIYPTALSNAQLQALTA